MSFKAVLSGIDKALAKLKESFLTKVCDKIADIAVNAVNTFVDYESTVTGLKNNLKFLSKKASDVNEEIWYAEVSGNKKGKREVVEWLKQVKSIEDKCAAADADQPDGVMRRLLGGRRAAQLNRQVEMLREQSSHFGDQLLLEVPAVVE